MSNGNTERSNEDLQPDAPRGLLLALRGQRVLNSGRREQEEVLAMRPCLVSGHRYRALRDYETGQLFLLCRVCGEDHDWTAERDRHEGVGQ